MVRNPFKSDRFSSSNTKKKFLSFGARVTSIMASLSTLDSRKKFMILFDAATSPDNKWLAACSTYGDIYIWNIASILSKTSKSTPRITAFFTNGNDDDDEDFDNDDDDDDDDDDYNTADHYAYLHDIYQ